jgi:hypothetical protein
MKSLYVLRIPLLAGCLWFTGPADAQEASLADAAATAAAVGLDPDRWNFRVTLNDKEIGYHTFRRSERGDREQIDIRAEFEVKVLFVTAFRYRHDNTEIWQGDCLESIESETRTNGDLESVSGTRVGDDLRISTVEDEREAAGCISTFAYWDRDFLNASELLNSQTGELMPVEVEALEPRRIPYRGAEIEAQPYRVTGEDLQLEVFYAGDRWVGLESTVEGGRTLRYEMIQET